MPAVDTPNHSLNNLTDHQLLEIIAQVVTRNPVGLFTTVDSEGSPHARWMVAGIVDKGLCRLYALTGAQSRKLRDLADNPSICWVFSSPCHDEVVTITGRAAVLPMLWASDGSGVAWLPLLQATRHYAMGALTNTHDAAFIPLEITVERIELLSPKREIYSPWVVPFERPARAGAGTNIQADEAPRVDTD